MAHRFKSMVSIKLFTWNTITIKGIEDKNTKNSINSKNYPKSRTLRELEKLDIDWLVYCYKAKPCGRKRTSEKMSVDSIQHQPPQLTLKLGLVRLRRKEKDKTMINICEWPSASWYCQKGSAFSKISQQMILNWDNAKRKAFHVIFEESFDS